MIALGCNRATWRGAGADHDATAEYAALGTAPGFCHHGHTGACLVGVTTQDPQLTARLDPEVGAGWVINYFKVLTMELTALARACGKSNIHTSNPRTWSRSPSRRPPWPGYPWPARTGFPGTSSASTTGRIYEA